MNSATFALNMKSGVLLLIIIAAMSLSCSDYQRVMNGDDVESKVSMADSLFKLEDYNRAKALYNEAKNAYLQNEMSKNVLYKLAYCEFYTDEKYLSSYHFNRFYETYPYSTEAEDALYMSALSKYDVSPKVSLDQASTRKAIASFQLFASRYPTSARVDECNKKMDELRIKLELKAFNSAKLWHQVTDYKSAVTALNNFITEFPGSKYNEQAEFLILESSYELAKMSVPRKKLERFIEAQDYYRKFKSGYPSSEYLEEANTIETNIKEEINTLREG